MLTELQIRDFAIVKRLELNFGPGMTVLTGETGAGKSIAIDALGLALGERADSSVVRQGCSRAEVIASFHVGGNTSAREWLRQHELDDENTCILRRTVAAEGGSKAYINGRPVPAQMLRTLAESLIDIHSQHQHQALLRQREQRRLLDAFGELQTLSETLAQQYQHWQKQQKRWQTLQQNERERASRIDFLRFQLDELNQLAPQADEWPRLQQEHRQLAHAEETAATIEQALHQLYSGEHTLLDQLRALQGSLEQAVRHRPELAGPAEMLGSAAIEVEEAALELRQLGEHEADPARLAALEQRIGELVDLARKHRCEPGQLTEIQQQLQQELEQLEHAQHDLEHLRQQIDQAEADYLRLARDLTSQRKQAATELAMRINQLLPRLGMPQAKLTIELQALAEPRAHGLENILFLAATNPGQSPKPLAKIASGGELSRISLAIQVATSQVAHMPTLVFDEVDVGIGGQVAETVGRLLRQLGEKRQIICITHQAQVAAQGHHHLRVEKQLTPTGATTAITALASEARCNEIARMIGGSEITPRTLAHAREMLQLAQHNEQAALG